MKRVFHHYEKWEDWREGIYSANAPDPDETLSSRAARLLSDPIMLGVAMRRAVERWPISAEVNLSNRSRNRQAWLGQAACCLVVGAPEVFTSAGWRRLSLAEQEAANLVADEVIAEWEAAHA